MRGLVYGLRDDDHVKYPPAQKSVLLLQLILLKRVNRQGHYEQRARRGCSDRCNPGWLGKNIAPRSAKGVRNHLRCRASIYYGRFEPVNLTELRAGGAFHIRAEHDNLSTFGVHTLPSPQDVSILALGVQKRSPAVPGNRDERLSETERA